MNTAMFLGAWLWLAAIIPEKTHGLWRGSCWVWFDIRRGYSCDIHGGFFSMLCSIAGGHSIVRNSQEC